MSVEGVIRRRVGMIPLIRVTDMRYEQSPLGRMLAYGTFRLESANRANVMRTIKDLPTPTSSIFVLSRRCTNRRAVEARLGLVVDSNDDPPKNVEFAPDQEFEPNVELRQQFAELSDQIGGWLPRLMD
jgi:hypothetical protein